MRKTTLGHGVQARGRVHVRGSGRIEIGARAGFESGAGFTELVAHPGGHLSIGESTLFNYGCIIEVSGRTRIGSRCLFGHQVFLIDCDMHGVTVAERHTCPAPRPITIEDDVWICSRAVILPGVTIGRGSVVSAGSVIVRDVPPYSLVAGNPARVVKEISQIKTA